MKKFSIILVLMIFVAVMVMMVGCHIDPPAPVDESFTVMSFNVRVDAIGDRKKTDYDTVSPVFMRTLPKYRAYSLALRCTTYKILSLLAMASYADWVSHT